MELNGEEDGAADEEGAEQAGGSRSEDGAAAGNPPRTTTKASDVPTHMLSHSGTLGNQDGDELKETRLRTSQHVVSKTSGDVVEPERDAPSVSPVMDSCGPSISSISSCTRSSSLQHIDFSSSSSTCGSALSLSPPLPSSVELSAVMTDTRLTLDVYQGGAAALVLLWGSIPEQLRGLQYLRLGSEERSGLDGALEVLPHLTALHSLAIRGTALSLQHSYWF